MASTERCELRAPSREGDPTFADVRKLVREKGIRSVNQLLAEPALENFRSHWTVGYRLKTSHGPILFGKSAQLVAHTRKMFPEADKEDIEFIEFDPVNRNFKQALISFPNANDPNVAVEILDSSNPALDQRFHCNECHSDGRENPERKPIVESVFGKNFGMFGELAKNERGKITELVSAEQSELKKYLSLVNKTFGSAADDDSVQTRNRLTLLQWRAKAIPPNKNIAPSIHSAIPAPNTFLLDKIQELNFLRVLRVIQDDPDFISHRFVWGAWAQDACKTPEDWASFSLMSQSDRESLLGQIQGLKQEVLGNTPILEDDLRRIGTLNFFLANLIGKTGGFRGDTGAIFSSNWFFSDSKGGIRHFQTMMDKFLSQCTQGHATKTCAEWGREYNASMR